MCFLQPHLTVQVQAELEFNQGLGFPEENNEEREGEVVDGIQEMIIMMAQGV